MSTVRILHTADLHLDSPFEGLSAGKAAVRRREQRELFARIITLANREKVDLLLFSGDLFDSDNTFYETGETLVASLKLLNVPVFIAPGNHDYYSARSPYARLRFPENVTVFSQEELQSVTLPELGVRVYGAAFTDTRCRPLLENFHAPREEGVKNLLCIHGEVGVATSIYNPISAEMIADSGMDYIALGHVHKASGLLKAGSTWYSQPGCPEGRGFDELGEKSVNIIELDDDGGCSLRAVSLGTRRYEILSVDVSGSDPLLAVHRALPDETMRDIYRIILTGEVSSAPDMIRLQRNLEEFFFSLQLRDETRLAQDIWERTGEDTLRGIFLKKMRERYEKAPEEERLQIEHAVRWGLAAIDNREEVSNHADQ